MNFGGSEFAGKKKEERKNLVCKDSNFFLTDFSEREHLYNFVLQVFSVLSKIEFIQ
jgi:hypothetical protein